LNLNKQELIRSLQSSQPAENMIILVRN